MAASPVPRTVPKGRSQSYIHLKTYGCGVLYPWTCKYCDFVFSEKATTKNVLRHVDSEHPDRHPNSNQRTLDMFIKSKDPNERKKEINDVLLDWIIDDMQALSVVENQKFKTLMKTLEPNAEVPCQQTVTTSLKDNFGKTKNKLLDYLQGVTSKFSISIDLWTSRTMYSYMCITIHFIKDAVHQNVILGFVPFLEDHTGRNIALKIVEVIEDFDLNGRILSITSDNGSNVVKAMEVLVAEFDSFLNVEHLRCAAHVLHLVVTEALKKGKYKLMVARKVAATLRNSTKFLKRLEELAQVFREKYVRPVIDVETRWNSTVRMIEVLMQLQKSVNALQAEYPNTIAKIDEDAWKELEFLLQLLSPFKSATTILFGSSYITVSTINTIFSELGVHLLREKFTDFTGEMHAKLFQYWNKHGAFVEVATFLDPRIRLSNHHDRVKQSILEIIKAYLLAHYPEPEPPNATSVEEEPEFFSRLLSKKRKIHKNDIEAYLKFPDCDEEDPLVWWGRHKETLPRLYQASLDHLASPATSVPCEQAFSGSGQLITDRRNRLSMDNVRICMCLWSWNRNL